MTRSDGAEGGSAYGIVVEIRRGSAAKADVSRFMTPRLGGIDVVVPSHAVHERREIRPEDGIVESFGGFVGRVERRSRRSAGGAGRRDHSDGGGEFAQSGGLIFLGRLAGSDNGVQRSRRVVAEIGRRVVRRIRRRRRRRHHSEIGGAWRQHVDVEKSRGSGGVVIPSTTSQLIRRSG